MTTPSLISSENLKVYTLSNSRGTRVEILNLGATVFNLYLQDFTGKEINVIVGPENKETYLTDEYIEENRCFGSSVGRYAGRISHGKFELDGKSYSLFSKDGVHLHGGQRGFQYKLWELVSQDENDNSITLKCVSPDGEEGYPGDLEVEVTYKLTPSNELVVTYTAVTTKATPVNLTNHAYYDLSGGAGLVGHNLSIAAGEMLEVDEKLRPTGNFVSLEGQPNDFSGSGEIGEMELDDTYVLNEQNEAIRLSSPITGIELVITTNQPGVVIFIPESLPQLWEYKKPLTAYPSICLETQNLPDAPNHKNFPSSILRPGERYLNQSSFKFSILK